MHHHASDIVGFLENKYRVSSLDTVVEFGLITAEKFGKLRKSRLR